MSAKKGKQAKKPVKAWAITDRVGTVMRHQNWPSPLLIYPTRDRARSAQNLISSERVVRVEIREVGP